MQRAEPVCQMEAPADDLVGVEHEAHPAAASVSSLGFVHNADYREFVDGHFIAVAMREGLMRLRGVGWQTEVTDIDSVGEVLCAASYDYNKARCVLARVEGAIVMLVIQNSGFVARLAAATEAALDEAEQMLREVVPETPDDPEHQEASITFWHGDSQHSGVCRLARLPVPKWAEISSNYAADTGTRLERMMRSFRPGHGGRLLLWTGPPGTGKTYALRALAWEWRSWCWFHYVTDPEVLFGSGGQYLTRLVMRPGPPDYWKLLVLEDTGELLAADAKTRTGQGLSRLLNVVDGLIGQGFPTLVLVTTNDELRTMHPAITRPGRCADRTEFSALGAEEASAWLAERKLDDRAPRARTIAELYAIAEGFPDLETTRPTVGFAGAVP